MFYIQILLVLYSQIFLNKASIILSDDFTSLIFTTNQGWNLIEANNPISVCSDGLNQVSVFGSQSFGQNTVIYKSFELQSHYSITLDFQFWIIDYQQNYDYYIYVDDQMIGVIAGTQILYSQDLCGNSQFDGFGQFTFSTNHLGSMATVIITSNQDQSATQTSWGIRDVYLSINICPLGCVHCQDEVSQCTMWMVDHQFWTNLVLTSQEGWQIMSSNFAIDNCFGLNFLKLSQVGDTLSNTINIKPYYQLNIQFKILKAGNFMSETITLKINSIMKFQKTFNQELYKTQCSGQLNERDVIVPIILNYLYSDFNSNQLNLQFSTDIQSTARFWGIRDFYIFISPCIDDCLLCTNSFDCQQCDNGYTFDGTNCLSDIPEPTSPYVWTNYYTQFIDQMFTNRLQFNFTNNQNGNTITQCNGNSLLGGYQVGGLISGNISNLPFHNRLRVRVTVYAIDQWYIDNPLQMSVDGIIYNIVTRDKFAQNQQNLCGNSLWGDNIYQIDVNLDHLLNYTILSFNFLTQQTNQYFGIREILVDYYFCGPQYKCGTCDLLGNCLTCSDPKRVLANGCNCPTYETNNQQCPECDDYNKISICSRVVTTYYCETITYTTFCQTCDSPYIFDGSMCHDFSLTVPVFDFIQYPYLPNKWQFLNYPNDALIPGDFTSQCGGQNLLGGLGHKGYLSMTLTDIPPYRRIRLIFKTIIIDQGDGEDLYFIVQGIVFQTIVRDWKLQGQNLCGDERPEYIFRFDKTIPMTGELTITIHNSNYVENYFGIYDFSLQYQLCSDIIRCATCDDIGCLTCSNPVRIPSPQCLCPTYEYMNYAECPTCPYKCQGNLCNLQGCIACADSSRGQPPDCLCSTYEIYGEPFCPPCQLNCLYCTQTMCLQCQSGYYAYGEYCYLCPYQCETCLYNGCLTCSDPQRGPAPFCRCYSYEIQGQSQCPQCPDNCQNCDQNGCLLCVQPRMLPSCDCPSYYYEIENKCIECDTNCETCNQYQCLTCPRSDLILPYCICPTGYLNINGQCIQGVTVIETLGFFNQQLTQIIIELNEEFFIIGLDNVLSLNQENCVLLKNSNGLCQIQNQKIIYQFDSQLQVNIGDEIQFNMQYFGFLNSGSYYISSFYISLNDDIDYRPYFDLSYPNLILVCKSYIIQINNVIYVGHHDYTLQILNDGDIQTSITNKQVSIIPLIFGKIIVHIKITNFVSFSLMKTIIIESNQDLQIDFEIIPQLGQLNRFFNLIVQVNQIIIHNCVQNFINQPITKIVEINFHDQYIAKVITNSQQYNFNINLGSLSVGQIYQLNVTASYLNYTKTQLTNYTINLVKPFFSILGGNRMIYYNKRLNVSAIIVDPDTQGLICSWSCVILDSNQDCGFNFTSQMYQIIENYQLQLYKSYQFTYNCLGIEVKAIYNIVDINQDQLFIFYPAFYSTYDMNQIYPVQYIIFNETLQNLLKPIILGNINIKVMQNFSIILMAQQNNSYGQQDLNNYEGSFIIQAQIDSMISSFNFASKNLTMIANLLIEPKQGIYQQDQFYLSYQNFNQTNQPYLFRYIAHINDNYTFILSDWSIYQAQQFFLPLGDLTKNYSLNIIGQIIDKFGYIYNKTSAVQVLPQQSNLLDNLIDQFNDQDNYYKNMLVLGYQFLQIQQNGCDKNCSNQGLCINNECICSNFYLLDCSANQTQFDAIQKYIQKLLYDLINTTLIDSQFGELTINLISNHFVYDNLEQQYTQMLTSKVISTMYEKIFQNQQIQINDIDLFVESLQNPQNIINQLRLTDTQQVLIKLVDISFGLIYNSKFISNQTLQNEYLMNLMNITKLFAYYQGSQLYQDQKPYQIEMANFQITAYRVSNNFSQMFFNHPKYLQNQINFLDDQQIIQLKNDSIVGIVIFNNNPYLKDENYPYPDQNNQVSSIQIYDNNGTRYRSFQPLAVQLEVENLTNNSSIVCIGQENGKWISQICQKIKITNSNKTSCQCDTLDQSSVVNDVNNLYTNSKIYSLTNYYQLLNQQIYQNFLAYVLISFGICSIILGYKGYKKDQIDYSQYLNVGIIQIDNQNNQNNQNFEQSQLNLQSKNLQNKQLEINYDSEEEEIIIRYDLMRMKFRNLKIEILIGIKQLHQFIRIYNEFLVDQPRTARYIIYFLKQCILLSVTSIFGQGFSIIQNISLGIISMILITPLEKLLMHGFNYKTKIKIKLFLSVFIIIIYIACWYVCITISLSVGIEQTNKWTFVFFISFLINQILIEGFTIVLKITLAPYLPSIIFKGGFIARLIYLYLYDQQALKIVKDLNQINIIQF